MKSCRAARSRTPGRPSAHAVAPVHRIVYKLARPCPRGSARSSGSTSSPTGPCAERWDFFGFGGVPPNDGIDALLNPFPTLRCLIAGVLQRHAALPGGPSPASRILPCHVKRKTHRRRPPLEIERYNPPPSECRPGFEIVSAARADSLWIARGILVEPFRRP
jgi:hypothetical protein